MTNEITQETLSALGFENVHMNPNYNGGYHLLVKELPRPVETSLRVTFGCHYCRREELPHIVWFHVDGAISNSVALVHIRTIEQLNNLWLALTGEQLEAK